MGAVPRQTVTLNRPQHPVQPSPNTTNSVPPLIPAPPTINVNPRVVLNLDPNAAFQRLTMGRGRRCQSTVELHQTPRAEPENENDEEKYDFADASAD